MDKRATYKLSVHPSSYYLELFKAKPVEMVPSQSAFEMANGLSPRAEAGQGVVKVDAGELEFEVYFETVDSQVSHLDMQLAEEVLAHIVEIDRTARNITIPGDDFDHDESLAYIDIRRSEAVLHYHAHTVNTEWDTHFEWDAKGKFRCTRVGLFVLVGEGQYVFSR